MKLMISGMVTNPVPPSSIASLTNMTRMPMLMISAISTNTDSIALILTVQPGRHRISAMQMKMNAY